ncbi:MAG: TolC family protein [Bacteroidales bacterium]
MNNKIIMRSILSGLILFIFFSDIIIGQVNSETQVKTSTDSLSLKNVIKNVVSSYPTVKVAEEAINNADAKIGLAKTGYNPVVDISASFANMAPVIKFTFPGLGTFQLNPNNNYSAAVNYQQLIYDFGRTRQYIKLENENKALGEQTLEQVKQKLSLYAINNFYTLDFLQSAIKIKDEELDALNEHLSYIEKMMATGSATEYQVLSTKVKISTVESQKVDLEASLIAQQASLNSLLGNNQSSVPVVKNELSAELPVVPSDSLLSFAFRNRDEVLIVQRRKSLAELSYGMTKLQNKPVIGLQASAGAKNGYIPDLNKFTPNYVIGLGLSVPIFDGMKNRYNLLQAKSAVTSLSYESETIKRNISNEVYEAEAYLSAAVKKVTQFELQLKQALKAYSLAETSFRSGVITNLDLLDANTSVSESRLMLLKSKIDYAASIYKLKAAMGERVY